MSADAVYTLDYELLLAAHRGRDADVTMVTTEVSREEATRLGVVETGDDDRVTGFQYKPDEPATTIATIEVFAYRTERLLEVLEELAAGDGGLEDFGHALLPRMVADGNADEYRFDGARIERSVVDQHADIGPGARVGGPDGDITLVGERARVEPGDRVEPGARVPRGRPPHAIGD
jgi:ADP-glucose pyrophosphorylase